MLYICKGLVISVINGGNIDIISGGISDGIIPRRKPAIMLLATMEPMRLRAPAMVKGMPM